MKEAPPSTVGRTTPGALAARPGKHRGGTPAPGGRPAAPPGGARPRPGTEGHCSGKAQGHQKPPPPPRQQPLSRDPLRAWDQDSGRAGHERTRGSGGASPRLLPKERPSPGCPAGGRGPQWGDPKRERQTTGTLNLMYQFDLVPKVPGKDKGTSPRGEARVPTRVRGNTARVGLVETQTRRATEDTKPRTGSAQAF